ncbi:hypothetical protein [Streptomyces sp. NPDC051572]|uniref:hypothetical protein n=1 Tax=Streptomyces sp. NPDC051572 TaxID=3155802 RepID=UPI00344CD9ED
MADPNSADGAAEFGVGIGIGIGIGVDFGAVEAVAVTPGAVTARCTLSVPPRETGAALPRLTGRLSGSVTSGTGGISGVPTTGLLGVTGTASCGSPTPPAAPATARCTATGPATFPPVP